MKITATIGILFVCLAFSPVTATADDQQDQSACMVDAQTFCGQFIPDRERVAHCLMANRHKITAACRVALSHFK